MITRIIHTSIQKGLDKRKAIIVLGARQVGKSTLLQQVLENQKDVLWLNGDNLETIEILSNATLAKIKTIIGRHTTIVIDEAQKIPNIGLKLKLITDQIENVQVFASGSSSFELASKVNESLAGRKREFHLFPLSFAEMVNHSSYLDELSMIPHRLIYGYYPEVVTSQGEEQNVLKELVNSYLYKDILTFDGIHKSDKIVSLIKALALQIGSQVSYNEIGNLIGLDSKTVEKYVDILEKSFIIFRLPSYAKNARNELKFSRKIYFWDLGVRNAVIANTAELENRTDVGALWENFAIVERMKQNAYGDMFTNSYFWRTQQQKEIDYIEESNGELHAFEFKWNNSKKVKCPEVFSKAYPNATFSVITPKNLEDFINI